MLPPLRPSVPWVRTTTAAAAHPITGSPSPGVERRPSLLPPLRPLCPPVTQTRSSITNAAATNPILASPSPGLAQSTFTTTAAPDPISGSPSAGLTESAPDPISGSPSTGLADSVTDPISGSPSTGQTQSTTTAAVPPQNPGWVHDANRPHSSQLPRDWRDPVTGANRYGHIPNPDRRNRRRRRQENGAWRAANPEEAEQALAARTRRWEQRRRQG